MIQTCPINLYGVSRYHRQHLQIIESEFKVTRSEEQQPAISPQNAIRFVSWINGWNFVRIQGFPQVSRSDIINQIRFFIENNTTPTISDERVDEQMDSLVKSVLTTFAGTIDSLSNTLLNVDETPNITTELTMHIPPISIFETINILINDPNVELMPMTTESMLRTELQYYMENNKTFRPYDKPITTPYLMMIRLLQNQPNADLNEVLNQAYKVSHEITFQPNTNNLGVAILKRQIADYLNALEIAIPLTDGQERDHHFELIRRQLLMHMYDKYQLTLLFTHFEDLKKIHNEKELHIFIDHIFQSVGKLICTIQQNPSTLSSHYEKYVAKPLAELTKNLQLFHIELCSYTQFKENKFGYPYSMADIISAHLFQIMLLMMSNVDHNTLTKLCVHTFGIVLVDLFYQRLITHIWLRQPPVNSTYIEYVLNKFKPIQQKFNINSFNQLQTNLKSNEYQIQIKNLVEEERWDNSFFDFLLTLNFSYADRHKYNLHAFAKKIYTNKGETSLQQDFCGDILNNLNSAINSCQMNKPYEQNNIYLYNTDIIGAVYNSKGVEHFLKTFNGGTVYQNVFSVLFKKNDSAGGQ